MDINAKLVLLLFILKISCLMYLNVSEILYRNTLIDYIRSGITKYNEEKIIPNKFISSGFTGG